MRRAACAAHRLYHEANGYLTGLIPNDEWRVRKRQDYYFNCIRDVDQQVVQILDQLDRLEPHRQDHRDLHL